MFLKYRKIYQHVRLAKKVRAFTLMELVIVIAIIALMSVAVYANYASFGDRGKVIATSVRMKEDLDAVRTASMDGQTNGLGQANGWGVYFDKTNNNYILFSDLNDSKMYDYPTKILIHGSETVAAGSFTDSSTLGNVVTVLGATQTGSVGKPTDNTGYWSFDGAGDNLLIPHNDAFNVGVNNFTIDLWFKTAVTGSKKALFYKGDGLSTQTFAIYKDASDLIKADIYDVNGDVVSLTSTTTKATIGAGTWYHLAITRTGNIVRLFINGAVHQSQQMATAVRAQSQPFYVGTEDDGAASPWNGSIDEVRLSVGYSTWSENFTSPTVSHKADDEFSKQVNLDPKLNFQSLAIGGTSVDQLSVFYNPTDYYVYANGSIPTEPVRIKLNAVGAESGSVVDSQRSLEIASSGLAMTYICQPNCSGLTCGDDGCGGQCGNCSGATPVCQNNACVSCETAGTCTWDYVGQPGFSLFDVSLPGKVAFVGGDTYSMFTNQDSPYNAGVFKFNGASWVDVSYPGVVGTYSDLVASSDSIYFSYFDDVTDEVKIVKYNGSSWVDVGSPQPASSGINTSLFVYDNTPYIAYYGVGGILVKQYNGSTWVDIGSTGVSGDDLDLFVDSGMPYVVYNDGDYKASVMKYNGSSWVSLGTLPGSSAWTMNNIYVDSGTPYVAYNDDSLSQIGTVKVMRYNGSAWVDISDFPECTQNCGPNPPYGPDCCNNPSLSFDAGNPYIVYYHQGDNGLYFKKYNGSGWTTLGFSAGNNASLVFYNNVPYMAIEGSVLRFQP